MNDVVLATAAIVGTAAGVALKSLWDAWVKLRTDRESLLVAKHLELAERRLSEFWWPLRFGLEKDTAVWTRILDRRHDDPVRRRVADQIEKSTILPNHVRLVQLIESKIHLIEPDEALMDKLLAYVDHVAVYAALGACPETTTWPMEQGAAWPVGLVEMVRERTDAAQRRYNDLSRAVDSAN